MTSTSFVSTLGVVTPTEDECMELVPTIFADWSSCATSRDAKISSTL